MKHPPILFFIITTIITLTSCNSAVKAPQTLDLNGTWQFRKAGEKAWTKATVPGVVQLDMLQAGLIDDPFYGKNEEKIAWIELENWEYERSFEVDKALLEQEVIDLVFEGLDTYAEVKVNGQAVLKADNMFCTWRVDCKKQLKEGKNTISILFKSPIKEKEAAYHNLGYQLPAGNDAGAIKVSPFVRKAQYQFGWDWGPRVVTMGIWRPVYLEGYSLVRIDAVYFEQQEVEADLAKLRTQISLEVLAESGLELVVRDGEQVLAQQSIATQIGKQDYYLDFELKNPRLWWSNGLGKPNLYHFTVELKSGKQIIASHSQKVGLRKIELIQEKDSIGTSYYFKLNGQAVFMKGANYIPQDNLLPRVSPEDYKKTIQNAVAANMNMLRVWGGGIYEADLFYDLCDENGILVWQDFMFACNMYPSDTAFLATVKKEVRQNVKRLRNHACIALWCGNNEMEVAWENWGWQQQYGYSEKDSTSIIEGYKTIFNQLIPNELERLKTQQPYVSTSPLSNWGTPENFKHHSMHYWGVWHGREPFENYKTNVGRFMSEYGFQSFPEMKTVAAFADSTQWDLASEVMQQHQKSYIGNGMIQKHLEQYYPSPNSFQEFVYLSQLTQAYGIEMAIKSHRQNRHCMGTLYWQLNDCWTGPSWSSVDYFGRWKALHYGVREWYREVLVIINQRKNGRLFFTVASDKLEDIQGQLKLELISFEGELLWDLERKITIPANASTELLRQYNVNLLKLENPKQVVLKASLTTPKSSYQQLHYFAPPKDLELKQANINIELQELDGAYELSLSAATLVKNVMLQVADKEIQFSDNYFDLLPNEKKVIRIQTAEKLDKESIQLMTINQLMNLQ